MRVFDELIKSKALVSLVFFDLLMVLTQGSYFIERSLSTKNRSKKAVVEEKEKLLKINRQITVLLSGKERKILRYLDVENQDHNLSITITPCSSTIKCSLAYIPFEDLKKRNSINFENVESNDTYEIDSMKTIIVEKAQKGWYFVVFHPHSTNSMLTIFVSMDSGGPHELTFPHKSNIRLIPLRKQRLKIMWNQSLVNPQNMSYCLVVNTRKKYSSLCEAEEERLSVKKTESLTLISHNNLKTKKIKNKGNFLKIEKAMKPNNDTAIVCVDRKLQLTLSKMKRGVKYYFNLFAINNKTNLTIPYGTSSMKYQFTVKSLILKDGIRRVVDLRMMEGKVSFKYKALNSTKELHFYVLTCGGAVDVEFVIKGVTKRKGRKGKDSVNSIPKETRVIGYKNFKILYPAKGEEYYLKVTAPNVDELTRIKYVEVFATAFPAQRYPMPVLPEDPNLYEFKSQKTCSSVTIGWIPVFDTSVNKYCVKVWENRKLNYADVFRGNFQCGLDERQKKKWFFLSPNESSISSICEYMVTTNEKSVTNYKIRDLKPGSSYTVQVTVKKKNGRTLSYKFLKVYTKRSCEY